MDNPVPIIKVTFTNGFGNNLFQYIYARLLSSKHNGRVSVNVRKFASYSVGVFKKLGIDIVNIKFPNLKTIRVRDRDASVKFYGDEFDNCNFNLKGYFEDYKLYIDDREEIKSWFLPVKKYNNRDLVFHLRTGDRLFYHVTHNPKFKIDASQYVNAIKQFDFDRLHIVTDIHDWGLLSEEKLSKMKFHRGGMGGSEIIGTAIGINNIQIAVDYFNSIYEALNIFNPIVRCGREISDDFNYIRSFDKILFQHGTMAWWASFLSEASKVGVYKLWRPSKGKTNKNLGQTNLEGWFHWF